MSRNHPLSSGSTLLEVGTDHTLAPLALRERLAVGGQAAIDVLQDVHQASGVAEVALLSTCNRTEIYLVATAVESAIQCARQVFAHLLGEDSGAIDDLLVVRTGSDAVRHLCAVASGLQSMVMAEGQILGQVREAGERAQRLGTAGIQLGAAFRAAVACGKRVRSETAIGQADISASSVLIEMITRDVDDWQAQRILLIGAGRMNQVTAERLHALGAGAIVVTSRTLGAATALAGLVGGTAIPLHRAPDEARHATMIVSATRSPGLMLTASMLTARPAGPLLVIDLAVPRDVDPAIGALPGVRLLDIDAITAGQDQNGLDVALVAANQMVDEATGGWLAWCRIRDAVPLIADLRAHVDHQRDTELARTLAQLDHLSKTDRAHVSEMANRLVNKMFHHLAIRMKKAAADPEMGEHYLEAARFLFQRDETTAGPVDQPAQAPSTHTLNPTDIPG